VHIGQLADVADRRGRDSGRVEILVSLDRVEPPAGRIRVVRLATGAFGRGKGHEIRFAGWLGMLRALYEVTRSHGTGQRGGA
jgi:hypothetical protein